MRETCPPLLSTATRPPAARKASAKSWCQLKSALPLLNHAKVRKHKVEGNMWGTRGVYSVKQQCSLHKRVKSVSLVSWLQSSLWRAEM